MKARRSRKTARLKRFISQQIDTFSYDSEEANNLVKLWVFKILVLLGASKKLFDGNYINDDDIAAYIGLEEEEDVEFNKKTMTYALCGLFADHANARCSLPKTLECNINKLGELLSLSNVEKKIVGFAVILKSHIILENTADLLDDITALYLNHCLSILLDEPLEDVTQALKPTSLLSRSGVLSIDLDGKRRMESKIDTLTSSFVETMLSPIEHAEQLFNDLIKIAPKPALTFNDFSHISEFTKTAKHYLKKAIKDSRKGVNILIYGSPGTGKTEFVRTLAGYLNTELYELSVINDELEPINPSNRFRAYRLAQQLFKTNKQMLLFDEVEDIFDDGGFFAPSTAQKHKGWMNNALENNVTPTFWLTNNHHSLDSAFIRRFDLVFEMPVPSQSKRLKLINNITGGNLNEATKTILSESAHLTTAVIKRAVDVTNKIHEVNKRVDKDATVIRLINQTLTAQGHSVLPKHANNALPQFYSTAYINCKNDVTKLARGLAKSHSARICLYGPPGTGKTAYVNWLSKQIDKPIVSKLVSELQSPYLGVAEKNIANAFEEAESESAILLFDEVDSFLQDRSYANKSWEVSQVNEMLKQMENYQGYFFAVTNLVDTIDKAALRRFDMKMKFDYMNTHQSKNLFKKLCASLNLKAPNNKQLSYISNLDILTPGDMHALMRQQAFSEFSSVDDVITELVEACDLKQGHKLTRIGFQ